MDSRIEHEVGNRARIVLLSLLVAGIWIVLSVVASSAPASAADNSHSGDSHWGTLSVVTDELPAVSAPPAAAAAAASVSAVVQEVAEPAGSTVVVVEQIVPVASAATLGAIQATSTLVAGTVQPVLEHPHTVLDWLELAGDGLVAAEPDADAVSDASRGPGPSLERLSTTPNDLHPTEEASTSKAGVGGDAGPPVAPMTPAPTPTDAVAPAQNPGGISHAAAILGVGRTTQSGDATISAENDALPSSANFDTDCSPD